jgi:hypothetical protein
MKTARDFAQERGLSRAALFRRLNMASNTKLRRDYEVFRYSRFCQVMDSDGMAKMAIKSPSAAGSRLERLIPKTVWDKSMHQALWGHLLD